MSAIVTRPAQLTEEWAQSALRMSPIPLWRNAKVNRLDVVSFDIGTTTRIRLSVDHDDKQGLARRWFVKLPSLSYRARAITALPRLLPTEIRFYQELADSVPLLKPTLIAAKCRFGLGSVLVMSDVCEFGASPGLAGDGLNANQARSVVEELAGFHASFKDRAKQDRTLRWLAGPVRRLEDALGTALAVPLMRRGLRLAADAVAYHLHAPALRYACDRKEIMRFLSSGEPTLIHHDCHPGNIFWLAGRPGFLDWQMVRLGEGVSDISYFMATALEPEVRRACEMPLLRDYAEIVSQRTGVQMDFNRLVDRYRAHLTYPFEAMVLTLAVGGLMNPESNLVMIRRSAQAVEDHEAFRRVLERP